MDVNGLTQRHVLMKFRSQGSRTKDNFPFEQRSGSSFGNRWLRKEWDSEWHQKLSSPQGKGCHSFKVLKGNYLKTTIQVIFKESYVLLFTHLFLIGNLWTYYSKIKIKNKKTVMGLKKQEQYKFGMITIKRPRKQ